MKHVIESQQFSQEIIFDLFNKAEYYYERLKKDRLDILNGKIMASLFYEESTRTRLSFESSMLRLGGNVLGTENARMFSSVAKGESLEDTIRVLDDYCDIIVLRHNEEGAAQKAAELSKVPIINAGDGKGQHPTQALLDIYTIYKEFKKLDNLKIAIVGDLANGRTARSLCYLLTKFENNSIFFISPKELKMGEDIKDYLIKRQMFFTEKDNLNEILPEVDIIYMTRIQKERMDSETYEKTKGRYIINMDNFNLINKNSRILHPLPHVEEIQLPINIEKNDSRVAYFRQAENGLYIRMALLDFILLSDKN